MLENDTVKEFIPIRFMILFYVTFPIPTWTVHQPLAMTLLPLYAFLKMYTNLWKCL